MFFFFSKNTHNKMASVVVGRWLAMVGGDSVVVMVFQRLGYRDNLIFSFSDIFSFHGNPTFSWGRVEIKHKHFSFLEI